MGQSGTGGGGGVGRGVSRGTDPRQRDAERDERLVAKYPQGASKWLDTIPAGKAREQAAEAFINNVSYQEPALAAKWVMELATAESKQPGQNNRNSYRVENLARTWLQQDEKAARAWIQQAPLSEERKKLLLQPKQ